MVSLREFTTLIASAGNRPGYPEACRRIGKDAFPGESAPDIRAVFERAWTDAQVSVLFS